MDEILATFHHIRKAYNLSEAEFELERIERDAAAKSAAETIIGMTLDRHAPEIYSKPDPVFDEICNIRRGKRIPSSTLALNVALS